MTLAKIITITTLSLGLVLNMGCSSSSPGTSSSTVVSTSGITSCTTSTTSSSNICIPNLQTEVDYEGKVAVTNAALLQTLLTNDPLQSVPSQSYITSHTYIDILLQPSSTGPSVTMTIFIGQLPQNALPIDAQYIPYFEWDNVINGPVQFTANTSNPSAGTISVIPAGLSILDYINITSSQNYPWDGSYPDMPAMTITIGSQAPGSTTGGTPPAFGSVGLINVL